MVMTYEENILAEMESYWDNQRHRRVYAKYLDLEICRIKLSPNPPIIPENVYLLVEKCYAVKTEQGLYYTEDPEDSLEDTPKCHNERTLMAEWCHTPQ